MAGATGNVVGIELSDAMIEAARRHCRAENLSFRRGDVSQPLALADEFADVVTGFMVLHNLRRTEMRRTLSEVERVLKPSGRAAFLTMHPDAFESQWHLQFLSYDAGLVLTDERDLWIDRETAVQMFGIGSIGCMPTTPTYWMLTLAKSGAVTNGHADAALLNGFISEHQAAVASSKQCGLCSVIPLQMRTADIPRVTMPCVESLAGNSQSLAPTDC